MECAWVGALKKDAENKNADILNISHNCNANSDVKNLGDAKLGNTRQF
jgi:hypothetical protein